jgi:hypothetical protein
VTPEEQQDRLAGQSLLAGTIAGQLGQLINLSYPIRILAARPLVDHDGNYRRVIEVEMASGTYYVTITDHDPHLDSTAVITEEP